MTIFKAAAFDLRDGTRRPVCLQHWEQGSFGPGAASRGGSSAEVPLLLPGSQNPERPGGRRLWLGHRQLPGRPAYAGQLVLLQADRKHYLLGALRWVKVYNSEILHNSASRDVPVWPTILTFLSPRNVCAHHWVSVTVKTNTTEWFWLQKCIFNIHFLCSYIWTN